MDIFKGFIFDGGWQDLICFAVSFAIFWPFWLPNWPKKGQIFVGVLSILNSCSFSVKNSKSNATKPKKWYWRIKLEVFYLNSTLNFGIPPVLVFQLEVCYRVDRLLTGITAQQKGTTARWYSNKTSLECIVRLRVSKWGLKFFFICLYNTYENGSV